MLVGNWVKSKGVSASTSVGCVALNFPVVAIVGVPKVADSHCQIFLIFATIRCHPLLQISG